MIHYQLICAGSHEFDGWFKDSENFERQARRGLILCPICASTKVDRALMAPRLRKKGRVIDHDPQPKVSATPAMVESTPLQSTAGMIPDQVRAVLHKLRAEVEKNCDYVGNEFATEARKIHHGEAKPRGIYGESTEAEAEALADDGIDVARIPWLPRADS
ncbi:MAG: DUF1178 family protein [Acidocella sp.]|nr:DUF1178 family protein [Acidocella sp.]